MPRSTKRRRQRQGADDTNVEGEVVAAVAAAKSAASSSSFHVDPTAPIPPSQVAGHASGAACKKRFIDLYDPDLTRVAINTPVDALDHVPAHDQRDKDQHPPFVLCRDYWNSGINDGGGACRRGSTCSYVHATPPQVPQTQPIHVNFLCSALERSRYPRLDPGRLLAVFAPNGRPPSHDVPSESILVTRGSTRTELERQSKPMSHCAHYHFNRVCNRGANCLFVHVVQLCPEALHGTVAPPPHIQQPAHDQIVAACPDVEDRKQDVAADVPTIEISRASPNTQWTDATQPFGERSSYGRDYLHRGPATSLLLSGSVDLHGSNPTSLSGSFAQDGTADHLQPPPTGDSIRLKELDECGGSSVGQSPPPSPLEAPVRTDSFRSPIAPRSPSLRAVSVGLRTLLFVSPQPKDKDGVQTPASDSCRSDGGSSTTPIMFRHNPYGTPSSRGATPDATPSAAASTT